MSNQNVNVINDINNNIKHRKNELVKLKKNIIPYLDKIKINGVRGVFDSFLEWNFSDDEDFYEDTSTLASINSKKKSFSKYPARLLYNTYDDFLSGYENDNYLQRFKALVADEKKQIEKVYVKDLLKLDIDMNNFNEISKNKILFNKKMTNLNNIYSISKERAFNFKSNENRNDEDIFKIMTVSGDYKFNYKQLSPYIYNANSLKNEDATKPIVIHFGKKQQAFIFKSVNINDDEKGKKSLYGKLNIEDLFKRAQCLSYDRYETINKPITVIIKFLKMLKTRYEKNKDAQKNKTQNIYSQKTTKMNYSHYGGFKKNNRSRSSIKNTEGEKNLGLGGEKITKKRSRGFTIDRKTGKERSKGKEKINSNSPRKKFIKINNEIYSFNELKNYFREEKPDYEKEKDKDKEKEKDKENKNIISDFNKREELITKMKNKIDGFVSEQKNKYHDQLKKRVEKLLYLEGGSFNNGDNKSINEMYNMLNLSNSDILMKENEEDDEENTNSNGERRNIKFLQNNTEEEMKDSIPDISPTYETKFINGFKFKMDKNPKK
jgi:hypothetical protein